MTTTTNTCEPGECVSVRGVGFRVEMIESVRFYVSADGTHYEECERCGSEHGRMEIFRHVAKGVCFRCRGARMGKATGTHADSLRKVKARTSAARRREAVREAEYRALEASRAQLRAEYAERHPDVAEGLLALPAKTEDDHGTVDGVPVPRFLGQMRSQLMAPGTLTEAQTHAARSALANFTERLSSTRHSRFLGGLDETVDVSGTIRLALTVNGYGYGTTSRMVVLTSDRGDDVKIYSTAQWARDARIGDRLDVTGAVVKRHEEYQGALTTVLGGRFRAVRTPAPANAS